MKEIKIMITAEQYAYLNELIGMGGGTPTSIVSRIVQNYLDEHHEKRVLAGVIAPKRLPQSE